MHLLASNTRFLGYVAGPEAQRLLSGGANVYDRRAGKVRSIILTCRIEEPSRPASAPSLTQYTGQRYTFRRSLDAGSGQVARCFDFKRIDSGDRDLFCLSVIDNLRIIGETSPIAMSAPEGFAG